MMSVRKSLTLKHQDLTYVNIAVADADSPRNDTANIVELADGRLVAVWHKYRPSPVCGSDFGVADIACKMSWDGGVTWQSERIVVESDPHDLNVQAPALTLLPDGQLLLAVMRAHSASSSSMCLYRSGDGGQTWAASGNIWSHSPGQWLQGGATGFVKLASGQILFPFHWGEGTQGEQHNTIGVFASEDFGRTWRRTAASIDLPLRGAMEPSIAQLPDARLILVMRSQLGTLYLSESKNEGESWSKPWSSDLVAPESCSCLRWIEAASALLVVWNDCGHFDPTHHHFGARTPLSAAVSRDAGRSWTSIGDLETDSESEFTNVNCTVLSNGDALISYWQVSPAFTRERADRSDLKAVIVSQEFWEKLRHVA